MILLWAEHAWEDYLYWQETDKKVINRVNALLKDIQRHPFQGIGNPEPLKHHWSDYWSRRIDRAHRIIYKATKDTLYIVQCHYYY